MSEDSTLRIDVEGRPGVTVTALRSGPARGAAWTFVYAPGASANIHDPFGKHLAAALSAQRCATVRFQFPYMEAARRAPDRAEVLEDTWRSVIDAVRAAPGRLAIGGRSMGGRIASMVHADGVKADALVLFAYPLHPPGKPQQLRTEHLPSITARTLFVSGTSDAFASPQELRNAAALVTRASVHLLDGADHGFAVKKSSGRTKQDVWEEAVTAALQWLAV
jgi:predicted alpha/beta-hydrolase family hydrolase